MSLQTIFEEQEEQQQVGYNLDFEQWRLIDPKKLSTDKEKRIAYRLNSLGSFYFFSKVTLHHNRFVDHFHKPLAESIEAFHLQKVIEVPRDHFKTTLFSESAPMWWALPFTEVDEQYMRALGYSDNFISWMRRAHDRDTNTLVVSETIDNAVKIGIRINNHYASNALFRNLFPEILPDEQCKWTEKSMAHKRTKNSVNGEGTFDFLGVGGALQSRHYKRMIEDDLVGRKALKGDIVMNDTIEYHKLLVGAFDSSGDDKLVGNDEIVVGNRWSEKDLNQWMRENEDHFEIINHSALGGCCTQHPLGKILFPEEFTLEKLEKWKKRLGPYLFSCFPANTPVLMKDFSERNIQDLQVGDEIVGYDLGEYAKLISAKVEAINKREAFVMDIELESGKIIKCTPDHKWLKRFHRSPERGGPYSALFDFSNNNFKQVCMELVSVYDLPQIPNLESQRDYDWLGGIFDGEGSCTTTNIFISQSTEKNPVVWENIKNTLERLNITFSWREDSQQFVLCGGRSLIVNLLKNCRMYKRDRFINRIWSRPARIGEDNKFDKVKKVLNLYQTTVYNIQSSSENYVAWGFATKNCQFLNDPVAPGATRWTEDLLNYYEYGLGEEKYDKNGNKYRPVKLVHETKNGKIIKDIWPRELLISMVVDPNHSGSDGSCRHAITVTGLYKPTGRLYLLDCFAESVGYEKLVDKIFEWVEKWSLRKVWLETVAAQKYLKFHLDQKIATLPFEKRFKIEPLKTERTENGKALRIEAMDPFYFNNQFFCSRHDTKFVEEFRKYPVGKTVDILDTLGYAPQTWENVANAADVKAFVQKQNANNPFAQQLQSQQGRSELTGY